MSRYTIIVVLGVLCVAGNAHAQGIAGATQPRLASTSPLEYSETRWYGYQILAVDVASFLAMSLDSEVALAGLGGVFLGGPTVHALNGQGARALASGALRVGLPLLGLAAGVMMTGDSCNGERCLGPIVGGGVLGMGAALVIDWTLLSRKTVVEERSSMMPAASISAHGVNVGLMGRF